MTNGDCMRQWTDEQLADFAIGIVKRLLVGFMSSLGIDNDTTEEMIKYARDEYLAWIKEEVEPAEQDEGVSQP